MPKTTLSISEARAKIYEIADDVEKYSKHYTLTENGRSKVVIMAADEFEAWQETLQVMEEIPDLDKDIAKVKKDIKSGAVKKYRTIEEIIGNIDYGTKRKKISR